MELLKKIVLFSFVSLMSGNLFANYASLTFTLKDHDQYAHQRPIIVSISGQNYKRTEELYPESSGRAYSRNWDLPSDEWSYTLTVNPNGNTIKRFDLSDQNGLILDEDYTYTFQYQTETFEQDFNIF